VTLHRDPRSGAGGESPDANAAGRDEDGATGGGDPELAAMRSVWLAMRDEEPPSGGMAELLAAARVKAEAMASRPSRWRRLAAMLRRPPVLALATVVVLIGGAVLLGRRLGADGAPARQAMPPGAPVSPALPPAPRNDASAERDAGRRTAPAPPPSSAHAAPRRDVASPDLDLVSRLGSASDARRSPLVEQCEAAARRGDCPAVRRLVEQISRTDPGYRARVVQDAAFARCLE
jgi:hypothetical protein